MSPSKFQRLIFSARRARLATLTQLAVLTHIANASSSEECTHAKISDACRVSRTGASQITSVLRDLEFIHRIILPGKKDDAQISLTPLGRAWLESVGIRDSAD